MINLSRSERVAVPNTIKKVPGPGQYFSDFSHSNKIFHSFRRTDRGISELSPSEFKDTPGPGAYLSLSTIDSKKSAVFSNSPRFEPYGCEWKPGPGTYDLTRHAEKTVVTQFKNTGLLNSNSSVSIPGPEKNEIAIYDGVLYKVGPAEYSPKYENIKPRKPAAVFPKSRLQRFIIKNVFENLGPGCYDLGVKASNGSSTFNKSERFNQSKNNAKKVLFPGPGDYDPNLNVVKSNTGCFVSKLGRNFSLPEEPIQENKKRNRKIEKINKPNAVFISKSKRNYEPAIHPGPGPGRYSPRKLNRQNGNFFSFSQETRFKTQESSPIGPGSYDFSLNSTQISPVTLQADRFQSLANPYTHLLSNTQVPGPGDYNIDSNTQSKGYSFSNPPRFKSNYFQHPDPGQYFTTNYPVSCVKIGSEEKFKAGANSYIQKGSSGESVGPGSYKIRSSLVKKTYNISWVN